MRSLRDRSLRRALQVKPGVSHAHPEPMTVPQSIEAVEFPVLLWRKGYSYVAPSPLELCVHPRSLFAETQSEARQGAFTLADSAGRVYEVSDFEAVKPFGGLSRVGHFLLRSVFAAPVLRGAKQPDLPEFCAIIGRALRDRFGKRFVDELAQAQSPREALTLVAQRERRAG